MGFGHARQIGGQRRAGGVQVAVAEPAVGLHMSSLARLVPGVDEHQGLALGVFGLGVGQRARQPAQIALRLGVVEGVAGPGLARLVVPAWHDARHEGGVDLGQFVQHMQRHRRIVGRALATREN